MPSPSPSLDQSGIEAPVGSHAGEIFGSQYNYGFGRASTISLYPYGTGTFKQLSRFNEKRTPALFAVFASLVAIVMLIYTCNLVYNRNSGSTTTRRRLSDEGSDSDSGGLIICEDTDEDVSSHTTSGTTSDEDDQSEPSSKVQKLETGGKRTAKTKHQEPASGKQRKRPPGKRGFTSEQERQGSSQKAGHHPAPQPATSTWLGAQQQAGGESAGGALGQSPSRTLPVAGSSIGPQSHPPVTTSPRVALIQHSAVIWSSESLPGTDVPVRPAVGSQPQPSPSQSQPSGAAAQGAGGEMQPSAVIATGFTSTTARLSASSQRYPLYQPPLPRVKSLLARHVREASTSATSSAVDTFPSQLTEPQPSTFQLPAGGSIDPQPSTSQLPAPPPTAVQRLFDPRRGTQVGSVRYKVCTILCTLRDLLAQGRRASQVQTLAYWAERTIGYLYFSEDDDVKRLPLKLAIPRLAYRYLAFSLLLSALPVLGEDLSAPWWSELTMRIPHAFERSRKYAQMTFNQELVARLSAAVATLKTGAFPDQAQTKRIEEMLFRSRQSPRMFMGSHWDPWRQADKDTGGKDDEDGGGDEDDA